jgi:hypothetical protein
MKTGYHKLPGRGAKSLGQCISRLYLGEDHLLHTESTLWIENYRRYYYSDIQAFIVTRTKRWLILTVVFLAILFGAVALAVTRADGPTSPSAVAWFVVGGLFMILLIWNLIKGPTCQTTIVTPIGRHALPSLRRIRRTEKILRRLEPLIDQRQGTLDAATLGARLIEERGLNPVIPPKVAGNRPSGAVNTYAGILHRWAFATAAITGALGLWDAFAQQPAVFAFAVAGSAATGALGIIALVRQHGSAIRKGLGWTMAAILAVIGAYWTACYFLMIFTVLAINNPRVANDYWSLLQSARTSSPQFYQVAELIAAAMLPLGIVGLTLALRPLADDRSAVNAPPALPRTQ